MGLHFCIAAARHLWVALLVGLMMVAQATAQTATSNNSAGNSVQEKGTLKHYVGAVPRTPADYQPITPEGRLIWFTRSTIFPRSLVSGLFSAGLGTAFNSPEEYGPHWEGFAQRYGMRLTGVSTGNAIEATLGAAWGEDPRYFHTVHAPFGTRVKNIIDLTFRAYRPDGERHLAYARYVATAGNNFLSNTWRVDSEADWQHALLRTAEGFGGRALSNAFSEFVPELWRRVRRKPDPYASDFTTP